MRKVISKNEIYKHNNRSNKWSSFDLSNKSTKIPKQPDSLAFQTKPHINQFVYNSDKFGLVGQIGGG